MTFDQACKLTNEQARDYLEKLRWDGKPCCPHCGSLEATKLQGKATRPGVYKCRACRKQFTVTVGTIFEDSHIELRQWVMAFCLVCSSKKGVSAHQLYRMLGLGSYKSAWHMAHRIRHAMAQEPLKGLLAGTIEADETWVGGRLRGQGKRPGFANKVAVAALIRREGGIRTRTMKHVTGENLRAFVEEMTDPDSRFMTDGLQAYKAIGKRFRSHESVDHSVGEYSRGDVGVNSAEAFFALLKRGVHGTFHKVGDKHLHRYCDEFAFRWNHRKISDGERTEAALRLAPGCRLVYTKSA